MYNGHADDNNDDDILINLKKENILYNNNDIKHTTEFNNKWLNAVTVGSHLKKVAKAAGNNEQESIKAKIASIKAIIANYDDSISASSMFGRAKVWFSTDSSKIKNLKNELNQLSKLNKQIAILSNNLDKIGNGEISDIQLLSIKILEVGSFLAQLPDEPNNVIENVSNLNSELENVKIILRNDASLRIKSVYAKVINAEKVIQKTDKELEKISRELVKIKTLSKCIHNPNTQLLDTSKNELDQLIATITRNRELLPPPCISRFNTKCNNAEIFINNLKKGLVGSLNYDQAKKLVDANDKLEILNKELNRISKFFDVILPKLLIVSNEKLEEITQTIVATNMLSEKDGYSPVKAIQILDKFHKKSEAKKNKIEKDMRKVKTEADVLNIQKRFEVLNDEITNFLGALGN